MHIYVFRCFLGPPVSDIRVLREEGRWVEIEEGMKL